MIPAAKTTTTTKAAASPSCCLPFGIFVIIDAPHITQRLVYAVHSTHCDWINVCVFFGICSCCFFFVPFNAFFCLFALTISCFLCFDQLLVRLNTSLVNGFTMLRCRLFLFPLSCQDHDFLLHSLFPLVKSVQLSELV